MLGGEGPAFPPQGLASFPRITLLHRVEPQEPKCPHQLGSAAFTLWSPAPSFRGHSGCSSHPTCGLKDSKVPYTGIREHLVSRSASQSCRGHTASVTDHSLQSTSDPETELGTESSPKAEVLPPEGRARELFQKGCQRARITGHLAQTGHFPTHHTPETHISYSLSSARSQGKSSPLEWEPDVCQDPQEP